MRIVALIPAHNEAERIAATVAGASRIETLSRVLVIDDGSSDATTDRARQAGAEVLTLERNVGKGDALQAGLDLVRGDADIIVLLDADLGDSASHGVALIGPVVSDEADMTIAILPKPPGSGGFGLVKGLARSGSGSVGRRRNWRKRPASIRPM